MQQADILVIGGGIAGTTTACYLAQYGHQVILLEQSELAAEASGLNAGTFWATGWGHTPDLSSTLSMGSLEIFKTLQLDQGYDLEFQENGSLQAIQTQEEYAFARQEVQEYLTSGHQVELLDGPDARSIEPALGPRILGCLYYPHGGSANPVKTVQALAALAQRHGATMLTHRQGQRLTRHLYGRQTRAGEIIIGGDRQLDAPKSPDQQGIGTNRAHALELFPFLQGLPIVRTWAGWMPFTRDLHPLIGNIPQLENLYLLTGLSSSGFEKGLMAGKLLAESIHHGTAVPILSQADPARQVHALPN